MMSEKDMANFQVESYELFKKYGLTKEENYDMREGVLITMLISPILHDETLSKEEMANSILMISKKLQMYAVNTNLEKYRMEKK